MPNPPTPLPRCPGCGGEYEPHGDSRINGVEVCDTCADVVSLVMRERAVQRGWFAPEAFTDDAHPDYNAAQLYTVTGEYATRRGGSVKSDRKAQAARENATQPRRKGRKLTEEHKRAISEGRRRKADGV